MKSRWSVDAMPGLRALRQRVHAGWQRWLGQRIPPAQRTRLTQKNVFIFLTPAGLVFTLFLCVLLLTAINYRNNMVFLLTFLLAGVLVVAILHTFSHLAGLVLVAGSAKPVFAGQMASFEVLLLGEGRRDYPAIELAFAGGEAQLACVAGGGEARVRLHAGMQHRGRRRAPRVRVENRYPLGLLRAWSWVDLDMHCLVYPCPVAAALPLSGGGQQREGRTRSEAGMDDFRQLRDYQPGDSLRHVAWKTWAKGQPLQTRQYQAVHDEQLWLDWEQFAGLDTESRLSRLCFQVLEADRQGHRYGLRLPGQVLPPAQGPAQREQALRALALFGTGDGA